MSGRVTTSAGHVLAHARISAFRRVPSGGTAEWQMAGTARSDDRGQYRLEDLRPGTYVVGTEWSAGETDGALPHDVGFYPDGRTLLDAVPVSITPEAEVTGVDLRVETTASPRAASIHGIVRGPAGSVPRFPLHLVPPTVLFPRGFNERMAETDARGEFDFRAIPAGDYSIRGCSNDTNTFRGPDTLEVFSNGTVSYGRRSPPGAQPPASTVDTLCGRIFVTATPDDPGNVEVRVSSAERVSGTVQFSGSSGSPGQASAIRLFLMPADVGSSRIVPLITPADDGTFVSAPIPPGDYFVEVFNGPSHTLDGWRVSSIQVSGRERIGIPVELGSSTSDSITIQLTNRSTMIQGTLRDATGRPQPDARVLIYPLEKTLRVFTNVLLVTSRIVQVRPDQYGQFEREVLPGAYLVRAFPNPLPQQWQTSEFLDSLASTSVPVTLALGERKTLTLQAR